MLHTYRCYSGAVINWEIPNDKIRNLTFTDFEKVQHLAQEYAVCVEFIPFLFTTPEPLLQYIGFLASWKNLGKVRIRMMEWCCAANVLNALAANALHVHTLDLSGSVNGDWSALSQFRQLKHLHISATLPRLTDEQIVQLGALQLHTLELHAQNFGCRDVSVLRALRANYVDLSFNSFTSATARAAVESLQPSTRVLLSEPNNEKIYWELQHIIAARDSLVDWLESQLALILTSRRRRTRLPRELHEYIKDLYA